MTREIPAGLVVALLVAIQPGSYSQKAMRQPELLTGTGTMISINGILSRNGNQLSKPWVVYSDRETDTTRFGEKYYVAEERETELHLYRASACRELDLVGARDMGWQKKAELLVSLGAEVASNYLLHKKCLVMIPAGDTIRMGTNEPGSRDVPLYLSPVDRRKKNNASPGMICFVYKTEKNRYLLGRSSRIDTEKPIADQIIGWVDRNRVFDYNNRICFEPNWEEAAVAYRKCHPAASAKVFAGQQALVASLRGDTAGKTLWTEPGYFFFRDPESLKDGAAYKENCQIDEKAFDPALRKKLCNFEGNISAIRKSRILTGSPLPGAWFRFPLVQAENPPENIFITGVPDPPWNETVIDTSLCTTLRKNKSQVTVYFILDHSVDRNRLAYVISQIQQEFKGFQKTYGVCFFPRLQNGKYRIPEGEADARNKRNNYQYVRDFILSYRHALTTELKNDDLPEALEEVVDEENFDSRHTTILVMVNNRPAGIPDSGSAGVRERLRDKLALKNCYLLAFDYSRDTNLILDIREISIGAAKQYATNFRLDGRKIDFGKTDLGFELQQSPLLSIIAQADSTRLAAEQMQVFLQTGYERIVTTLDHAISDICTAEGNTAASADLPEDPFQRALKEGSATEGHSSCVRTIKKGWSAINFGPTGSDSPGETWKAVVLMTGAELQELAGLMDEAVVCTDNSGFSKAACKLMIALFNRFAGDDLSPVVLLPMKPEEIMHGIAGAAFGYDLEDPVKQYPLRSIFDNDPEVRGFFEGYRGKIKASSGKIKDILINDHLRYCFSEEVSGGKNIPVEREMCYYWVPVDILP